MLLTMGQNMSPYRLPEPHSSNLKSKVLCIRIAWVWVLRFTGQLAMHVDDCQNFDPFLGSSNIKGRTFRGPVGESQC